MRKLIFTVLFAANLVGCASVNMGSAHQDAEAKKFIAPKENAGLYVYRNESLGPAIKMEVDLDGASMGQNVAKTYLYKEIKPGKHTLTSKAENNDTLEIDAKPGMLYYVWQEVKMGIFYARTKLHLVNESEGQLGVNETKLAETK